MDRIGPENNIDYNIDVVKNAAKNCLGVRKNNMRKHVDDKTTCELSELRHREWLKIKSYPNTKSKYYKVIRQKLNKLKNDLSARIKEVHNEQAEQIAIMIDKTNDSRKMFKCVKQLKINSEPKNLCVKTENGNIILNDKCKADIVKAWFEKQFTNTNASPIPPFDGEPSPLDTPITWQEVKKAARQLNNGREGIGPDGVQNELTKYAPDEFHKKFGATINSCFERNEFLDCIGQGILSPLQKPGKAQGPLKSLRSLILTNVSRKLLSLFVLRRIEHQVDMYTVEWQAGNKSKRGTSDIVWCQRMLVSVVTTKKWEFNKMGIDMSSAFDTIDRRTILTLLKDAGCLEDDVRIVRFLLSNTNLCVKIKRLCPKHSKAIWGHFKAMH